MSKPEVVYNNRYNTETIERLPVPGGYLYKWFMCNIMEENGKLAIAFVPVNGESTDE